jgi:hypothetical protein
VPLVPVAPVPVPVEVFEPGRRMPVSLGDPVSAPERARPAVSRAVPVPVVPPLIEPDALVPVAPVPDIEPDAPLSVPVVPVAPVVPLVAAAPVLDAPTSPLLVPAVLSRLLPLLQAPTVSTAASASILLPVVNIRMTVRPPSPLR